MQIENSIRDEKQRWSQAKELLETEKLRVITELLFILLPFVVVALVLSYRGAAARVVYLPEWAIAATVLEGQVLVKFISAFFILGREADTRCTTTWGGIFPDPGPSRSIDDEARTR